MSLSCTFLAVVSMLPAPLASLTQQSMLVAGAVGTGVLVWVLWNALHSDPVPKYDPWTNERQLDAAAHANGSGESNSDGVRAAPPDSTFGGEQLPVERTAQGAAAGDLSAEPTQDRHDESGATLPSPPSDPAEGADDVRAMLNQIEDPEVRRMLAESLKQIEGGASA